MGGIGDAHDDCAGNATPETEPERGHNNGNVVEPLKNVVEHWKGERREIVQEADPHDKDNQSKKAEDVRAFHGLSQGANSMVHISTPGSLPVFTLDSSLQKNLIPIT